MRGPSSKVKWCLGAAIALAALFADGHASAEPKHAADPKAAAPDSARSYYDRATSAFGLGNYAQAAELYEKAFELRADPALLYNAAQAHRLAGHKDRAIELYRNHMRLFPDSKQAADSRRHMGELQGAAPGSPVPAGGTELGLPDAVGDQPAARAARPPGGPSAPPVAPGPGSSPSPSNPTLLPPPPPPGSGATTAGADLTAPASLPAGDPAGADTPKRSHTWLWIALGGAVVAAGVTTAVLLGGGKTHDPTPSLGTVGEMSTP